MLQRNEGSEEEKKKRPYRCRPSGDKVNIWLSFRDNTVVASKVPFREQFKPRETDTIS